MDLFVNICVGIVLIEIIAGAGLFAWYNFDKWYTNHLAYKRTRKSIREEGFGWLIDKERSKIDIEIKTKAGYPDR